MRVGIRQGSASSASTTTTPNAAEMNRRACSSHSRPMSFNSLGPRRFGAESLDLDFAKRQSYLVGAAGDCCCLGLPQPNFIFMESRAAERRDRIRASQAVDAAAIGVSRIGPQRFSDEHAAANALEHFRMEP